MIAHKVSTNYELSFKIYTAQNTHNSTFCLRINCVEHSVLWSFNMISRIWAVDFAKKYLSVLTISIDYYAQCETVLLVYKMKNGFFFKYSISTIGSMRIPALVFIRSKILNSPTVEWYYLWQYVSWCQLGRTDPIKD